MPKWGTAMGVEFNPLTNDQGKVLRFLGMDAERKGWGLWHTGQLPKRTLCSPRTSLLVQVDCKNLVLGLCLGKASPLSPTSPTVQRKAQRIRSSLAFTCGLRVWKVEKYIRSHSPAEGKGKHSYHRREKVFGCWALPLESNGRFPFSLASFWSSRPDTTLHRGAGSQLIWACCTPLRKAAISPLSTGATGKQNKWNIGAHVREKMGSR